MGRGHAVYTLVGKSTTDSDAATVVKVKTDSGIPIALEHGTSTGDARSWQSLLLKERKVVAGSMGAPNNLSHYSALIEAHE